MRLAVANGFRDFTAKFEGVTDFPYLDVKNLVTTGIGNLIDPIAAALPLPWVIRGTGQPASQSEVSQAWNYIKSRADLSSHGGFAYRGILAANGQPDIMLTSAGIQTLVLTKLHQNEGMLRNYFPGWDNFPADAQMAILSMAWAMGPGFPSFFKNFAAAVNRGDWATAAVQSHMNETGNPGLHPRNVADLLLLQNADSVLRNGLDPETLYYPSVAPNAPQSSGSNFGAFFFALMLFGASWAAWHYLGKSKPVPGPVPVMGVHK